MSAIGWWALLVSVLCATGLVGLTAFRYGLLPALFGGAPYMPTNVALIEAMLDLAQIQAMDRVVDLGSGDGRLVIAAARKGAREAVGYEIDVWNVWKARRWAGRLALRNAQFVHASFWKVSLSGFSVVFVYGLPPYMTRLAEKCRAELAPGTRIVSLLYDLPGWEPTVVHEGIRLYTVH